MAAVLKLIDETAHGKALGHCEIELRVVSERVTARELVRRRIQTEVERFNSSGGDVFSGLVEPKEAERVLNGYRLTRRRRVEWQKQFDEACAAFERNGFLLLFDDAQVESLDEEIVLTPASDVRFIKLVPLVGG